MNNHFDISIIIPIYNVEEYLEECLDSVLASKGNFTWQAILVDDGSTDRSSNIAKAYSDQFPQMEYYRKDNGGLGCARNYGIERARGKYICFMDSDDIIANDMLDNLFLSAETNESDFSVCNIVRFNSQKVWAAELYNYLFLNLPPVETTNIHDNHFFLYDTISCNKIIRRDFWIKNQFSFPEGVFYEDIPVIIPMHLCAKKVSAVRKPGYFWRIRDGKTKSITQGANQIKNLRDRLAVLQTLYRFFDEHVTDASLRRDLDKKVLTIDLPVFIRQLKEKLEEEDAFVKEITAFIDEYIDNSVISELPILFQREYYYLQNGETDKLKALLRYKGYTEAPVETRSGDRYICLPEELFGASMIQIKNEFYNRNPYCHVDQVCSNVEGINIEAHLYQPRISVPSCDDISISAMLVHNALNKSQTVPVDQFELDYTTIDRHKNNQYNYDGIYFRIYLPSSVLKNTVPGEYHILIRYEHELFSGYTILHGLSDPETEHLSAALMYTDEKIGALCSDPNRNIFLNISDIQEGIHKTQKAVHISTSRDKERNIPGYPFIPDPIADTNVQNTGIVDVTAVPIPGEDESTGNVFYVCKYTGNKMTVGSWAINKNEVKIHLDLSKPEVYQNLYNGTKELLITKPDGSIESSFFPTPLQYCYVTNQSENQLYSCGDGRLFLWSGRRRTKSENTKTGKAELRKLYSSYLREPVNEKVVLFESMWGEKYSCNPQAFYKYMDENHPEYTCVWSLKDERTPIAGNAVRVKKGTKDYYHYLATAKYLFNNVNFETAFIKRPDQVMIQTMHGTPYKTVGLEAKNEFKSSDEIWKYVRKNQTWDYLIVQGKFTEKKAWNMYRYFGPVLRTGYPRTDILANPSPEKQQQLRKSLGIPDGKRLILYAPTWRVSGRFEFEMDFAKMKEILGDRYVLGVRVHHLCSEKYHLPVDNEFVFDLTSFGSIEDLYLITDVLVTDYSSVMFDFAMTGKPMVFYLYDLEDYKDNLRGVYFDLLTEAPGPIARTDEELISCIDGVDVAAGGDIKKRKDAFFKKFLTYERSDSCDAIYQQVFETEKNGIWSFIPKKPHTLPEKIWIHLISLGPVNKVKKEKGRQSR